jgi:hypothetical protein
MRSLLAERAANWSYVAARSIHVEVKVRGGERD